MTYATVLRWCVESLLALVLTAVSDIGDCPPMVCAGVAIPAALAVCVVSLLSLLHLQFAWCRCYPCCTCSLRGVVAIPAALAVCVVSLLSLLHLQFAWCRCYPCCTCSVRGVVAMRVLPAVSV